MHLLLGLSVYINQFDTLLSVCVLDTSKNDFEGGSKQDQKALKQEEKDK